MTRRPAFVLVYCLFVTFALAVATAGLLAVAARESAIASVHLALLRARAAAEAAVRFAVDGWSTRSLDDLPIGGARLVTAGPAEVRVERLDTTLFVITAEQAVEAGFARPVSGRAAVLVRSVDHQRIEAAVVAAVVVRDGAVAGSGSISGHDACVRVDASLPGLWARTVERGTATLEGDPPLVEAPPPEVQSADPFAPRGMPELADASPDAPAGTPRPVSQGRACVPGAWNWGAVSPVHPCHPLLPVIHSPGDLRVDGGQGRGALIVEGDLHLSGEFTFEGLLVVRGRLVVGTGVRIRGAARAGSLDLRGGHLALDRCALRSALAAPALDRAFRAGDRWWLPVF